MRFWMAFALALTATLPARAAEVQTSVGPVTVEAMATGLQEPWALAFLPDGGVLITLRDGRLLNLRDGRLGLVTGTPQVAADGQGGLLDVMVPRDFATRREVFLSFSKPQGTRGSGTALAVGRLNQGGDRLDDLRVVFEMSPGASGGRHFGSRIVEAFDGTLFLTVGDRGEDMVAQDLTRHNGSIIRINRDGSSPADNPFPEGGARPEIWSYGHRNPQGATLDLQGNLWAVEHGARGGDEINRIKKGANYGWPVIAYGRHYSGLRIGEGTAKPGMEQPKFYWDPSIAPSGMMIYSGKLWPDWHGDIFVGSLKFDYIARLDGDPLAEAEQITSDDTLRVRDIREAPDGSIWFLSVGQGAAYRMTPG